MDVVTFVRTRLMNPLVQASAAVTLLCVHPAAAGEIGHYLPGVLGIRNYAMPPKGVYYTQYNAYYGSKTLKNGAGDTVDSVHVGDREGIAGGLRRLGARTRGVESNPTVVATNSHIAASLVARSAPVLVVAS